MKKKLVVLLALLLVTVALVAACSKGEKEHKHTFGDLIAEVPASCFSDGAKAHYHCSECNKDFAEDKTTEITDLVIPAHITESDWVRRVEPTCETAGNIGYYKCPVCGKLYNSTETEITEADTVIPATGHTLGDLKAATKATCLKEGRLAHYECSACGKCFAEDKTTVLEDVKIAKLDHDTDGTWKDEVPATCEKGGTKGHCTCKLCGSYFDADGNKITNGIEIKAKGHEYGEYITDKEPTCTEAGSKHHVCKNCEKSETEVIAASGHKYSEVAKVAPKCEETGTAAHYKCDACQKLFVKESNGKYKEVELKDLAIPASGHSYNPVAEVPPECEKTGTAAHYKCDVCKKLFIEEDGQKKEVTADKLILAAKVHDYKHYDAVDATANTPGNIAYEQCTVCKKYFVKDEQGAYQPIEEKDIGIPPLSGHSYTAWTPEVPATCEADGTKGYYSCTHCTLIFDGLYNEITDRSELVIPHTGHSLELQSSLRSFEYDEGGNPTGVSAATEGGKEDHYKCSNCGKLFDLNEKEIQAADLKAGNKIAIRDDKDMAAFAALVNDGNAFAGESFVLLADVSLETTIGATSSKPFSGNFDGQGHTIDIHQALADPDGIGGLFSFVRTPEGGTVTIQNVHLTGRIDASNSNTGSGCFGGLVSTVDGNTSGDGGTINIYNVWNSLYINAGLNNMWTGVGGFIGFTRHADGLKPLTVNFDSCVWDGTLNAGPAAYHFGGFVGYTGNNKAGRTLTINIANSVASGIIALNQTWDQYAGLLVGYVRGGYSDAETAKVTVNVNNVLSSGKMTFKSGVKCPGSESKIGHIGRIDLTVGETTTASNHEINLTNLYYNAFDRGNLGTPAPALGNGTANTSVNVLAKDKDGFLALTGSDFSDSNKWNFEEECYPCPASFYETFGTIPASLNYISTVYIGSDAEMVAFAADVNSGNTYEDKTVKLTADIDLTESPWRSIGTRNNGDGAFAFKGTFDGQGHTVTLKSTTAAQSEGGLFGYLGDGAIVKNVKVTGSIDLSADVGVGYYGSVVGCATGTVQISNVWSNVKFLTNAKWFKYSGGFIGGLENLKSANLTVSDCVYSGNIFSSASVQESGAFFGYSGRLNSTDTKSVTFVRCVFSGSFEVNTSSQGYFEDTGLFMGYMQNNSNNTGKLTVSMTDCLVTGTFKFGEKASVISKNGACVIGWAGFYNAATSHTVDNVYYVPNNYPNESAIPAYNVTNGYSISGQGATAKSLDEMKALTAADFAEGDAWTFVEGDTPVPSTIYNTFMAE